jgi:chemotaxis protein methyltransferase CheR
MKSGTSNIPHSIADCLSAADYRRLADFIHTSSGIRMPSSKKTFLEGRLRKRLHLWGYESFDEYCHYVFDEGGLFEEATALIDAVTTNKTDFFREPHHFDFLIREGLPRLVDRGLGIHHPLRVWSAGCANGAEAYTIAMVCHDFAQRTPRFRFDIFGSDICVSALNDAARAVYPHAMIAPVPMTMRRRYLLRDEEQDEVRIVPELRRLVNFAYINLIDPDYRLQRPMDIVFCRNLLIYFDKQTQRGVLQRLCRNLRVGGYLILGHSESVTGLELPLKSVATTVYVREEGP